MAESIDTGIPEGITTVNCNLVEEAERKTEKMYKETWFLSQEEAEAKLKEMEEKDGR